MIGYLGVNLPLHVHMDILLCDWNLLSTEPIKSQHFQNSKMKNFALINDFCTFLLFMVKKQFSIFVLLPYHQRVTAFAVLKDEKPIF